jgi:hypothetical protein
MLATKIPSGDDRRPRPTEDRRILADQRCQCQLGNPHQCPAFGRVSTPAGLQFQRSVGRAAPDDPEKRRETAPKSRTERPTSAVPRYGLCYLGRSSERRACHRRSRTILASRWRALSRPHCGRFWQVFSIRLSLVKRERRADRIGPVEGRSRGAKYGVCAALSIVAWLACAPKLRVSLLPSRAD